MQGKWNGVNVGVESIRPKRKRRKCGNADGAESDDEFDDSDEDAVDEDEDEELAAALRDARRKKSVNFDFNRGEQGAAMRRRGVEFAHRNQVYGNAKRKRGAAGNEENDDEEEQSSKGQPLDINALGKAAYHGDMMYTLDHKESMAAMQRELYFARLEIAYLRGERLGQLAQTTFVPPGPHRTDNQNRQSRKTLSKIEPLLTRMWEQTDGPTWETEGLEGAIFYLIKAKCPGSNISSAYHHVNGLRIMQRLYDDPVTRRVLEKKRTKIKLFMPTEFLVEMRMNHVGQRPARAMRKFMGKQMYSEELLLEFDVEARAYQWCWCPCSETIESLVEVDGDVDDDAALAAAAEQAKERACPRDAPKRYAQETGG